MPSPLPRQRREGRGNPIRQHGHLITIHPHNCSSAQTSLQWQGALTVGNLASRYARESITQTQTDRHTLSGMHTTYVRMLCTCTNTPHHTAPHHTTLHYTPHHTALHHTTLHYTTHHTTLHCTTPHYATLHTTAPHHTTLHITSHHTTHLTLNPLVCDVTHSTGMASVLLCSSTWGAPVWWRVGPVPDTSIELGPGRGGGGGLQQH